MTKTYTFRLTAEGLTDLKAQMDALGDDGKAAFQKIIDATPGMAGALDQAAEKAKAAHDALAKLGGSEITSALGGVKDLIGSFGVSLSVAGAAEFAKTVETTTVQIGEQAKQLGISTDALQAYRAALQDNGAPIEQLNTLIFKLSQTLGQAEAGSQTARNEFASLGISWEDLKNSANPVEAAVQAVTAAIAAIPDPAQRAQAEMEFFGRTSKEIGGSLHDLSENVGTLTDKLRDQGRYYDSGEIDKAVKANKDLAESWQRLEAEASGPIVALTTALAGLVKAQNDFVDASAKAGAAQTSGFWGHVEQFALYATNPMALAGGIMGSPSGQSTAPPPTPIAPVSITPSAVLGGIQGQYEKALLDDLEQMYDDALTPIARKTNEALKTNADAIAKSLEQWSREGDAAKQQYTQALRAGDQFVQQLKDQVQLSGMMPDQAQRLAAQLEAIRRTHGDISQAHLEEIDQLIQMQQQAEQLGQVMQGIGSGIQGYLENFLETGSLNFGRLLDSWKQTFAQWLAEMATQALEQPIIVPMVQSLAGSLGLGGSAAGGSGAIGALSGLGQLGGLDLGGGSIFGGGVTNIGASLSGLVGALGFSTALPGISTSIAGAGAFGAALPIDIAPVSGIPGSLFGTTLGGALGAAGLGSLAGSLIFGNKNDASTGSFGGAAAGALLGSIVPGIGTLIGGLLGGVLGGGLGSLTGSSNQAAWADIVNGGLNYAITQQGSQGNTSATTQVAQTITQAIQQLQAAGVSITNDIRSVSVGSSKDYLELTSGEKDKLAANDPQGLIAAALNHILSSASSGDSGIQSVIASYGAQGGINSSNLSKFLGDIGFAQSLKDISFGQQQLSDVGQALAQINKQFDAAVQQAQTLGLDTEQLDQARQVAIDQLIGDFNTKYLEPLQALSQKPLDQFQSAVQSITTAVNAATKAAGDLGLSLDDVNSAAAAANAALSGNFNQGVAAQITQILDPNLAAYNALLATQAQRIQDAIAVGGDLNAVYQLNTLEQQQLTAAQQKAADQAAAQAAAQQAAAQQAAQQTALQAAQAAAAAAQPGINAKTGLAGLVQSLIAGPDSGASAQQKYLYLLTQLNQAQSSALASPDDATAITAFQTAAQSLLPVAHEYLGTSQSYGALETSILGTATALGGNLADPSGLGRAIVQAQTSGTAAIVDAVGSVHDQLAALNAQVQRLTAQMAAIINRVATA